ncbi:BH2555 [Halalkalibacterium halodurans C-125]|uniref:BH2555 protein n=1 Tax=Halalkalibacterium halodurans (strain ATCC BAA-125 / DSM 18197 / FERM 7344 / JCM 9153 / C-125) TaxID=272558 RepID=Q9K9U0_HALH5|nr:BH2555 [Halalkalibacterium halodurans C-125]
MHKRLTIEKEEKLNRVHISQQPEKKHIF